jgi:hypothetical protein
MSHDCIDVTELIFEVDVDVNPSGPPGPPAPSYSHQQSEASATWTINHNLGFRPSVELLDNANREIDGAVYHTSLNQAVAMFTRPVAGTARLT